MEYLWTIGAAVLTSIYPAAGADIDESTCRD
jgi:hypothetical protein